MSLLVCITSLESLLELLCAEAFLSLKLCHTSLLGLVHTNSRRVLRHVVLHTVDKMVLLTLIWCFLKGALHVSVITSFSQIIEHLRLFAHVLNEASLTLESYLTDLGHGALAGVVHRVILLDEEERRLSWLLKTWFDRLGYQLIMLFFHCWLRLTSV